MIGLVPNVEYSRDKDGRVTVHWPEGATATVISRELLDEMVEDMNARRWIPVGERLPVVDTTVLAVTRAFPENIRLAQMASRDGVMWRFCDMDDDDVDSFGITHWAPLPEPPADSGSCDSGGFD
jgi:hypothetical protein